MDKDTSLIETGKSSAASIAEMVAALECDYDRLEELKEERESFEYVSPSLQQRLDAACAMPATTWATANPDEASELAELEEAAGECTSREEAETRIQEDALSVRVRGDWHDIGDQEALGAPVEFEILLSTGGPASRIRGELDENCEPHRAWLEVQDWGTPWTMVIGEISQDTLLAYCGCFYFGEG